MTEAIVAPAAVRTGPPDGYLPIAEHGIIGDLHTIALVGTDGTIDWYCPDRFDAPSVFAAILDRQKGGYWRIAPATDGAQSKQLYMPDTNVLITRFLTPAGVAEVIDFMPTGRPACRAASTARRRSRVGSSSAARARARASGRGRRPRGSASRARRARS